MMSWLLCGATIGWHVGPRMAWMPRLPLSLAATWGKVGKMERRARLLSSHPVIPPKPTRQHPKVPVYYGKSPSLARLKPRWPDCSTEMIAKQQQDMAVAHHGYPVMTPAMCAHQVQFYDEEDHLHSVLSNYLAPFLDDGEDWLGAIVLARSRTRTYLEDCLLGREYTRVG